MQLPSEGSSNGEVSILARHYFEGETSIQMYKGRTRSDVEATIQVIENKQDPTRSRFPPAPTDENVAERINFLSNFLLDHTVVMGPGKSKKSTNQKVWIFLFVLFLSNKLNLVTRK